LKLVISPCELSEYTKYKRQLWW